MSRLYLYSLMAGRDSVNMFYLLIKERCQTASLCLKMSGFGLNESKNRSSRVKYLFDGYDFYPIPVMCRTMYYGVEKDIYL